jgi:hypothetical protein
MTCGIRTPLGAEPFQKDSRQRKVVKIPQLIEAQKAAATKTPKKEKKIQGGC